MSSLTTSLDDLGQMIDRLKAERDAARNDAAWWKDSLREVCNHVLGHEKWNPDDRTIGTPIVLAVADAVKQRDAALASLAEKQRAIDEAYAAVAFLSDGTALTVTKILRPHATPASPVAGPATVRPQCPPNVTITQGVVPSRDEVFGKPPRQWTSTPPKDRSGKWWHAYGGNGTTDTVLVPDELRWVYANIPSVEYNLWLPYVEGDTRDDLPPLPNPAGNAATPQVSPVGNDTRELVARLAECITGLIEETDKDGYPVNNWTVPLREIIAAARKGAADAQQ